MKKVIVLLFLIALGAAGYFFLAKNKNNAETFQQTFAQPTAEIIRGEISSVLTGRGKAVAKRKVLVTPTLDGKVTEILVEEGGRVRKGACLAKIELKADQQMMLLNLKRRILANSFEKKELQEQLGFHTKLQEEGLAAQIKMASLKDKIELKTTESQNLIHETELLGKKLGMDLTVEKLLNNDFSKMNSGCIYSPIDGTVVQLDLKIDDMVSSMDVGRPMNAAMVVADISEFYIDYKISELDMTKIRQGQEVTIIFDAFPQEEFSGEIESIDTIASLEMSPNSFIDPSKEASEYKATIRILSPNQMLRPDLSCRVSINTETRTGVLLAPVTSVFQDENGVDCVMLFSPQGPVKREVQVGIADFQVAEIIAGVEENDQVFLNPYKLIEGEAVMQADQSRTTVEKILR